jgi:peptide/nickel transport system substrate-binding protein
MGMKREGATSVRRFLMCAAICLALAGCTKVATNTGPAHGRSGWTQAGVLRVALPQDLKSVNPLLSSSTAEGFVDRLMFEPLVSADGHGRPVPMLATIVPTTENRGISKDGLTITYHLRRNARWSDGVPVTSRDVKWTWQAIMNPANDAVSRHGYDDIRAIDTPDDATVVVHLEQRFAPFVNTFFAESDQPYDVAPAHVLSKYPNINQIPFNTQPLVSDGPFRFVEWVHGDHITLSANDGFFMGKPKLKQIRIEVIPDEHTAIQLLRTHAIDYMFQASINTYPELKDVPGVSIVWNDMNGYQSIEMNFARPMLRDPRVRLAIACAIDKAELVKTLTNGQEKMATEDLPDWLWAFNPDARPPSFNPVRARQLLRESGWVVGSDGVVRRHGAPLRLVFVSDIADATHRKLVVLAQSMLKNVGIDATIKLYPADLLYAPAGMGGILHRGRFDLAVSPWYSGIDPDDSSQYMCRMVPPAGYNDSRYCDREMDEQQARALHSYDRATRRLAYHRIEELLARDNPQIFLWWQRQQEPISVDFKGFDPNPAVESWNAWQWDI